MDIASSLMFRHFTDILVHDCEYVLLYMSEFSVSAG